MNKPITKTRTKTLAVCSLALAAASAAAVAAAAAPARAQGGGGAAPAGAALPPLRPPSVPLVACDPYFSVWSDADRLTDDATRHWTGKRQSLTSLVRIDGRTFRLMGDEPRAVPALPQAGLQVLPTRTVYDFEGAGAHVRLTFTTAALPDDLDVLSRPVTYLTWEARSADGARHDVSVYFDDSAELAVNTPDQKVTWDRISVTKDVMALRIGSDEQPILEKKGDDLRIDWGYAYVAAPAKGSLSALGAFEDCAAAFVAGGTLPKRDDVRKPRAVSDALPVAAFVLPLGAVGAEPVARHVTLAYDDLYSVDYFGRPLRPYWRRKGAEAPDLLLAAERDYAPLQARCAAFDAALTADLARVGGERYARLAALSYRQTLAGNKVAADANGMPLVFPKENFSNGCIATVDVIYPMDPFFLLFSPALTKGSLATVMNYAASPRWRFPFAPHDLGTYPRATGQVYGGGERTEENQMPVEESGDLILLTAALAREEGNAGFAGRYWPQLTRWAQYLEAKGFDPENQLCTDDFAGHLAHNVNLSVKAIEALGAYGMLCGMRGDAAGAARYQTLAKSLAARWVQAADDGGHSRLAFDKPGTWSQKYNLVWDKILGLDLFPDSVARKEIAFYRTKLNPYGLPLDSRKAYTKLDWTVWSATLAGNPADWESLVDPIYDFLGATPDRVPMTDWYQTATARKVGFQARPVVGGVFIKMLADPEARRNWTGRAAAVRGDWAGLPKPPRVKVLVPTAQGAPVPWRYTTAAPQADWYTPDFPDGNWHTGDAGFGTEGTPGAVVRTKWDTPDIWIRREINLPNGFAADKLQLLAHHDEDMEVYLNGALAVKATGYVGDYQLFPIRPAARQALHAGWNVIAVHCHQTQGGQYVDAGLAEVTEQK